MVQIKECNNRERIANENAQMLVTTNSHIQDLDQTVAKQTAELYNAQNALSAEQSKSQAAQ